MAGPWAHGEQFEGNVCAEGARIFSGAFETIDLFLADVAHVQAPQLFAVDGGDGAVDLRVDDLILHRRAVR